MRSSLLATALTARAAPLTAVPIAAVVIAAEPVVEWFSSSREEAVCAAAIDALAKMAREHKLDDAAWRLEQEENKKEAVAAMVRDPISAKSDELVKAIVAFSQAKTYEPGNVLWADYMLQRLIAEHGVVQNLTPELMPEPPFSSDVARFRFPHETSIAVEYLDWDLVRPKIEGDSLSGLLTEELMPIVRGLTGESAEGNYNYNRIVGEIAPRLAEVQYETLKTLLTTQMEAQSTKEGGKKSSEAYEIFVNLEETILTVWEKTRGRIEADSATEEAAQKKAIVVKILDAAIRKLNIELQNPSLTRERINLVTLVKTATDPELIKNI